MPNPRFIDYSGQPTQELLEKIRTTKQAYAGNLDWFCERWAVSLSDMNVDCVYLIGSHAHEDARHDETSDIYLKLITPWADVEILQRYRAEVLCALLYSNKRKRDWVDLFCVKSDESATLPRYDVTTYWNEY